MAENTKERIITAAFSFYSSPVLENISLSQIAQRVGISKAAIFKHFKNKEALNKAMEERMFSDLTFVLNEMQKKYSDFESREALCIVIKFMVSHQEYMNYLFVNMPDITEDNFVITLKSHGVKILDRVYKDDGCINSVVEYFRSIYVSSSLLVFINFRQMSIKKGFKVDDIDEFARKLADFLEAGLNDKDAKLSLLRLTELDILCSESMRNMDSLNKILIAVSKVISEYGVKEITVEKVAKELGYAKSSLYTWFNNKAQMIQSLVEEEMTKLYAVIMKNISTVSGCGEKIYVFLQTSLAYFMQRIQIIDVCKWLQMINNNYDSHDEELKKNIVVKFIEEQKMFENMPNLGIADDDKTAIQIITIGWLFVLPVMLLLHGRFHEFQPAILQAAMKDMYFMAEFGVGTSLSS